MGRNLQAEIGNDIVPWLVQHSSQDDQTAVTATDVGRTGRHGAPGQKRAGGKRPDGQITWAIRRPSVQPLVKKYSDFQNVQITL